MFYSFYKSLFLGEQISCPFRVSRRLPRAFMAVSLIAFLKDGRFRSKSWSILSSVENLLFSSRRCASDIWSSLSLEMSKGQFCSFVLCSFFKSNFYFSLHEDMVTSTISSLVAVYISYWWSPFTIYTRNQFCYVWSCLVHANSFHGYFCAWSKNHMYKKRLDYKVKSFFHRC